MHLSVLTLYCPGGCLLSSLSCIFQTSGSFSFVFGLFFGTVLFEEHSPFFVMRTVHRTER